MPSGQRRTGMHMSLRCSEVVNERPKAVLAIACEPKEVVAVSAEQPSDLPGFVTVIDVVVGSAALDGWPVADGARPALRRQHPVVVRECDAVPTLQVGLAPAARPAALTALCGQTFSAPRGPVQTILTFAESSNRLCRIATGTRLFFGRGASKIQAKTTRVTSNPLGRFGEGVMALTVAAGGALDHHKASVTLGPDAATGVI